MWLEEKVADVAVQAGERKKPTASLTIGALRGRLSAVRTEVRRVKEYCVVDTYEEAVPPCGGEDRSWTIEHNIYEEVFVEKSFTVPDLPERMRALDDITKSQRCVQELLIDAYDHNDTLDVRIAAGRILGYSKSQIWAHEHPLVTLTSLGLVAAGCFYEAYYQPLTTYLLRFLIDIKWI